jgi:hypothetical protein
LYRRILSLLAVGLLTTSSEALAQPLFVSIQIYKVRQTLVCGRPYSDLEDCALLTATKFDHLKKMRLLERAWQSNRLLPDAQATFDSDLSGDANWVKEHQPENELAALMVVTWNGPHPRSIAISRTDGDGNNLSTRGDFHAALGPGRFFYHFPYDQIGRMILALTSRSPERTITYANTR